MCRACVSRPDSTLSSAGLSLGRPDSQAGPGPGHKRRLAAGATFDEVHVSVPLGRGGGVGGVARPATAAATAPAASGGTTPSPLPLPAPTPSPAAPSHLPQPPPSRRSSLRAGAGPRHSYDGHGPPQTWRTRGYAAIGTPTTTPEHGAPDFDADRGDVSSSSAGGGPDPDAFDPRVTLRPRSSWIRRLSARSSQQSSSRASSPRAQSPAVSFSNGSMSLSHTGSTAPMIGGPRDPPPLPPNKLVKRSSSARLSDRSPAWQTHSGSRLPTWRRPATSHQRSQTAQLGPSPREDRFEDDYFPANRHSWISSSDEHDILWQQYFSPKISKEGGGGISKKRGASQDPIRRIFPDPRYQPTLLIAQAVTPTSAVEVDDSLSQDGDSVFFGSRPATPSGLRTLFSSSPGPGEEPAAPQAKKSSSGPDEPRPRRSFSISDLIPSSSNSRKSRADKAPPAKLTRKSSRQMHSSPMPAMKEQLDHVASEATPRSNRRRDFSEPIVLRQSTYSTDSDGDYGTLRLPDARERAVSAPLPPPVPPGVTSRVKRTPHQAQQPAASFSAVSAASNHVPQSPSLAQPTINKYRYSLAPSEQTSTLVNSSDNEARGLGSGDEDDTDFQSESIFDSLRTRTTRSTSGPRGPRIETIFDASPPRSVTDSNATTVRELLPKGTSRESTMGVKGHSIAEEEESLSTPVKTIIPQKRDENLPSLSRARSPSPFANDMPSSPPEVSHALYLGTLPYDALQEDDTKWSFEEEDDDFPAATTPHIATPLMLKRSSAQLINNSSSSSSNSPTAFYSDHIENHARRSLYDWAEQPPPDKLAGNRSPPRPRTVHGKKDTSARGSRPVGRRGPSALHARSQSVPVVPDLDGKREGVVTNKFGTWGIGSKGVSEDWDDDFDFDDSNEAKQHNANNDDDERRIDSGVAMVVPATIRQRQTNVLANIGLLKEWGMLIEELKDLRIRAVSLGLVSGAELQTDLWKEVDGMIDLADHNSNDRPNLPRSSPPSSPTFDQHFFDDEPPAPVTVINRNGRRSGPIVEDSPFTPPQLEAKQGRFRRKSILDPDDDRFGGAGASVAAAKEDKLTSQSTPPPKQPPSHSPAHHQVDNTPTRARKNSEAVARSVIEALQRRQADANHNNNDNSNGGNGGNNGDGGPTPESKKVPFDTATLKHIVPHVNGLVRKVKDALREAEGLEGAAREEQQQRQQQQQQQQQQQPTPPLGLSGIFAEPEVLEGKVDGSPMGQNAVPATVDKGARAGTGAGADHGAAKSASAAPGSKHGEAFTQETELGPKMKLMTVM
ncbi:hypothetical protein BDY21DRAFT_406967 [Lineolata rhizophorae]|uniref:Uncharacterized protein n=1 Tax=Lineolata rhizophorae TaxID=578093 RepID=A0A6A6NLQ2_9PEZI|nr:hypothetical protein BDY21DRAFT_406967 [Lineolata rhizophorae]